MKLWITNAIYANAAENVRNCDTHTHTLATFVTSSASCLRKICYRIHFILFWPLSVESNINKILWFLLFQKYSEIWWWVWGAVECEYCIQRVLHGDKIDDWIEFKYLSRQKNNEIVRAFSSAAISFIYTRSLLNFLSSAAFLCIVGRVPVLNSLKPFWIDGRDTSGNWDR